MRPIISITTIPSRLPHIQPCLDSLKRQMGFHGSKIPVFLWIPAYVERLDQKFDGHIPPWAKWTRYEVVKDLGPITKLIPGLAISQTVITADDDCIYPVNWAKELLIHHERHRKNAYAYRGKKIKKGQSYNIPRPIMDKFSEVNFITGVHGAIYNKSMFDERISDSKHRMTDDVVISANLFNRGTPMFVIPKRGQIENYNVGNVKMCNVDDLYTQNKDGVNNNKAINDLYWGVK